MTTQVRSITVACAVAVAAIAGSAAAIGQEDAHHEVGLTLTGCVIPGRGIDAFFVKDATVAGHPNAPANAFYSFDDTSGLREHVGHRVEVKGKADLGDPDDATLRVSTENDRITTSVTSERERITMDSPVWGGTIEGIELQADVVSYGFDVESVRRVEGPCGR